MSQRIKPAQYSITVSNRQRRWAVDKPAIQAAVACVLQGEGINTADVSIAVVSDAAIHDINREFLNHDEPTDVISFVLEQSDGFLDGEIVVSADTAAKMAKQYRWPPRDELLLYVVHGALHLVGYDDRTAPEKRKMRYREKRYLEQIGVKLPTAKSKHVQSK